MSGITVVSSDPTLEERIAGLFGRHHTVRRTWSPTWSEPTIAGEEVCAASPLLVVLGHDLDESDVDDLAAVIDRDHPQVGVAVLRSSTNADRTMDLLRLGARDVLEATGTDEELRTRLSRILDVVAQRQASSGGPVQRELRRRVIAVVGPKGGSGKTTMATNLALGLARAMPNRVLIVDLDVQFGDVSSALGVIPEHSLADVAACDALNPTQLKVFLTQHDSSLFVLPPPDSLALSDDISVDALKRTLAVAVEEFPTVVIDTAAGIDDFTLVALEFATDLLFVSTTDVPSIRAVSRQVEALDAVGATGHRRHFLLNRADARVGLSQEDVEATVGLPASYTVPSARSFPISTNQGKPLVDSAVRDAGAKAMQVLVDGFTPESVKAQRARRRLLKRSR